jgi:hypothetical protein
MSLADALTIAKNSDCGKKGTITSVPYCNSETGTWWMDVSLWAENLLCTPACVVSVSTKQAEINYRCTGSFASDSSACERTGCNNEICQDVSLPARTTTCVNKPEYDCYKNFASCAVQANGHCGFTTTDKFSLCMTKKVCHWCGDQCTSVEGGNCNTNIPSTNKACVYQNATCQAVDAPCTWCGESCERNTPGKNCTKGTGVPVGLVCDPVGTGGQCSINGSPVMPTNAPGYCDDSCQTNDDCVGWLGCFDVGGIKRCRKPQCTDEHTCFCKNTPTPIPGTPKPLVTRIIVHVTATPTISPVSTITIIPTESPIATITSVPIAPTTPVIPTDLTPSNSTDIRILTHENAKNTSGSTFTMTGIAPALSDIRIVIDPDGLTSSIQSDKGGNWNLTLPTALSAGTKEVTIVATDANGMEFPYKTSFVITGKQLSYAQFGPYVIVFIGVGMLAVIVFFLLFLRRM